MSDSDMEDYGFDYSDEDPDDEDIDIENQYYNSKGMSDLRERLDGFKQVLEMESEPGEWSCKTLKQIVKVQFQLGMHDEMIASYKQLLQHIQSGAINRGAGEKKIQSLLDWTGNWSQQLTQHTAGTNEAGSSSVDGAQQTNNDLLKLFYSTTLQALDGPKQQRIRFKTHLKLANFLLESKDYDQLKLALEQLYNTCLSEDGQQDDKKGGQLLEVYALEITMATDQGDMKRLKQLYNKALAVHSAIPHPRVMGVIRECGGKMHTRDHAWSMATEDFFQAFKYYDEAGCQRRIACLKYLVLAHMMSCNDVDPFDAQETKPYKTDSEIAAMNQLIEAYHKNDIRKFEQILKMNKKGITDDAFICQYLDELKRKLHSQLLLAMLPPYTRVGLQYLSSKLNVQVEHVKGLLVTLILDGKLKGKLDEVADILTMDHVDQEYEEESVLNAVEHWNKQLERVQQNLSAKFPLG